MTFHDYNHDELSTLTLWTKHHVAKRWHLCAICNAWMEPGTPYRSVGMIVDGEFQHHKEHAGSCPRFRERDRREFELQFEKDSLFEDARLEVDEIGEPRLKLEFMNRLMLVRTGREI